MDREDRRGSAGAPTARQGSHLPQKTLGEVELHPMMVRGDALAGSNGRIEIPLAEDEIRHVTRFAAACARRVLPVFEAAHPDDPRPREAIIAAESFGAGGRRTAALRTKSWAAYAAAREAEAAPAAHAAYAASHAAGAAYLHPIASAHQAKHILGAAVHQALALELQAGDDPGVGSEQLRWAASLASPEVRSVLRRIPPLPRGRGRLKELLGELDAALRG
jgi:hypothetical protein